MLTVGDHFFAVLLIKGGNICAELDITDIVVDHLDPGSEYLGLVVGLLFIDTKENFPILTQIISLALMRIIISMPAWVCWYSAR